MTKLHRHKCSNCGNVVFSDKHNIDKECSECDDKYATFLNRPSPEHDEKIMEEPSDVFECPNCEEKIYATSLENGKDWTCGQKQGGCGFTGWKKKKDELPAPNELDSETATRQNAWSRYHRYQNGTFEYRD